MSRPTNPASWANRIEGRVVPPLAHVIVNISMRDDRAPSSPDKRNELDCACGALFRASTPQGLCDEYALHTGKRP